jgi:hypothetical protein
MDAGSSQDVTGGASSNYRVPISSSGSITMGFAKLPSVTVGEMRSWHVIAGGEPVIATIGFVARIDEGI